MSTCDLFVGGFRRLARIRRGFAAVLLAAAVAATNAATISSVRSGSWFDASTWSGGVPGASDDVVINAGHVVTQNWGPFPTF
ncbi:MAG: hypothetical protein U1D55_13395 [Phycisphaerae bacterium]